MRDNILYFGSEDKFFYAVNREGNERWRFQTQGQIKAGNTTKSARIYVGSTDFNLYALNRLTGEKEWDFPTGNDVLYPPYVDLKAGVVVAHSFANGIYGIDERTGKELWHLKHGMGVVTVALLTAHVTMAPGADVGQTLDELGRICRNDFGVRHCTIQPEWKGEQDCEPCE